MTAAISFGMGGLAGWRILQRAETSQIEAVSRDASVARATGYFRDNIASTGTAEELVSDYRMLSVALAAFGLEDDIANKAFIRKVLESDPDDGSSLVNRLSDKRYARLAEAFGFGTQAKTSGEGFGSDISTAYIQREFERRVGEGDESLRLALNARRELTDFAARESSNNTLWYEVLGNTPLRTVFEGAFGFGSAMGQLPIDRQLEEFIKASERFFGTAELGELSDPAKLDRLITRYIVRAQLDEAPIQSRYSAALTLLGG